MDFDDAGAAVAGGVGAADVVAGEVRLSSNYVASLFVDRVFPLLIRLGTIGLGLAGVAVGLLYRYQDQLLYFPSIGGVPRRPADNPNRYKSPAEYNLPYESHSIPCEDGVHIASWLILQRDGSSTTSPTLIFFHGNAGNFGLRLPNAVQMYQYLKVNVFMVEYRGYGDSDSATPNEAGLKLDAEAALRFVAGHPAVDPDRLFVFGRSLGGAVGFHLAQYAERKNTPLAGLIIENTFLSISDMVDSLMPYVAPFKSLVLRIGWDSGAIAPTLRSTPVLYLAGGADELVPHFHMQKLYRESSGTGVEPCRLHVVKGGRHNETFMQGGKPYWDQMLKFITDVTALRSHRRRGIGGGGGGGGGEVDTCREAGGGPSAPVATGMGMGVKPGEEVRGSIPIMPGNLVGLAKEVVASSSVHAVASDSVSHDIDGKKKN